MSSPPTRPAVHPAAEQPAKRSAQDSPSGVDSRDEKKIKTVTQACKDCRRNKAKCDGTRPKCGPCVHKGRNCGYEGEVGQSRQAAMKARLETLEKLFDTLQNQAPEDAERLLQRIRSGDELTSLLAFDQESADTAPRSSERYDQTSTSPTSSSSSSWQRGGALSRVLNDHSTRDGLSGGLGSSAGTSALSRGISDASDSSFLIRMGLPNQALTTKAVECFFDSTGQLFHLFSKAQVASYMDDIYGFGSPSEQLKKAVCCVACVAAVAVEYKADDFPIGLGRVFYDIARHHFGDVYITDRPLDGIKVCTLLGMYNIMTKATVSVAYIEVALGMSRRHSLSDKDRIYPGVSPQEWQEYRATWRCLIFFATWLSSTLGYITSDDVPLNTLMPAPEAELGSSADIIDTVQVEMTKISMLKANILRMHLAFKDLTELAVQAIMTDLQEWYHKLPQEMALSTLGHSDLPDSVRRSIYYVHLLYLGAIMLLYRRVASQYNRSVAEGNDADGQQKFFEQLMLNHAEQGVLAAKTSSRILGLLLNQVGCFKRCWIVIFQSYTSCVVLLHCIAQKQVHGMIASSWEDDLLHAKTCLDTLSYCGTLDPVALQFHARLYQIYQTLSQHTQPTPEYAAAAPNDLPGSNYSPTSSTSSTTLIQNMPPKTPGCRCYDPILEPHPFAYLLTIPSNGNPDSVRLSTLLLRILSRPYDNPVEDTEALRDGYGLDTSLWQNQGCEQSHSGVGHQRVQDGGHDPIIEKVNEWDLQSARPYRWDPAELRIPDAIAGPVLAASTRWLGSTAPSGWSTAV
ncbi:hypothetical protein GE09DRAFT_592539 [Coniochaeta sp. 2T2.1]|nr:hypothetical protein GE09DRAFT_592539 [Coniochaeta sp. 2T2.1]